MELIEVVEKLYSVKIQYVLKIIQGRISKFMSCIKVVLTKYNSIKYITVIN